MSKSKVKKVKNKELDDINSDINFIIDFHKILREKGGLSEEYKNDLKETDLILEDIRHKMLPEELNKFTSSERGEIIKEVKELLETSKDVIKQLMKDEEYKKRKRKLFEDCNNAKEFNDDLLLFFQKRLTDDYDSKVEDLKRLPLALQKLTPSEREIITTELLKLKLKYT